MKCIKNGFFSFKKRIIKYLFPLFTFSKPNIIEFQLNIKSLTTTPEHATQPIYIITGQAKDNEYVVNDIIQYTVRYGKCKLDVWGRGIESRAVNS